MNKKNKIIISVLVIIIFGLLAVGVMYYAKNNISSNDNQMGNVLEKPGNEDANTPPDKPEGDMMDSNDSTSYNKLNMNLVMHQWKCQMNKLVKLLGNFI